jgi:hypothetical protein
MSQSCQVLDGLPDSMQVVDSDVGNPRDIWTNVNKYQRHLPVSQVFNQRIFHTECQNCHAIDPPFDHPSDRRLHSFRVMYRRGQKNFVVVLYCEVFESLNNFGEERIRDLRNNQSEDSTAPEDESASLSIRVVSQFIYDFPDSFGELRVYRGDTIDCP